MVGICKMNHNKITKKTLYDFRNSLYSGSIFIHYKNLILRLSYQIPLITAIAIVATIIVNIVAFHYFMGTLFLAYTDEIQAIEQK